MSHYNKNDIKIVFDTFLEENSKIARIRLIGNDNYINITLDNMFYMTTNTVFDVEKILSFMESKNYEELKGLFGILYKTDVRFLNTGILIKGYDEYNSCLSRNGCIYTHYYDNSKFISFNSIQSIEPVNYWSFDNKYIEDLDAIKLCMKLTGLLKEENN